MVFNHLISKLEIAAKKALHFAEQEKEKSYKGAYFPGAMRPSRSLLRENFFREQYYAIVAIVERLRFLQESEEDFEEIVYLSRRVTTEMEYVWIRRKVLDEEFYKEIYKDTLFEPYAKDLPHQKNSILHSNITILGLETDLERELNKALLSCLKKEPQEDYVPTVEDVVISVQNLQNMFKDDWTKKANLIRFRLYEIGVISEMLEKNN